jgi:hypothetical protein
MIPSYMKRTFALALMIGTAVGVLLASGLAGVPNAAAQMIVAPGYLDSGSFANGNAPNCFGPSLAYLDAPVVSEAVTPNDGGYWQAATDGAVFTCGDAGFYGSAGSIHLAAPIVGIAATPEGHGYWLAAADCARPNPSHWSISFKEPPPAGAAGFGPGLLRESSP